MLPLAMPTARIIEFSYSQDALKQRGSSATISKLVSQFLQSLELHRETCPKRPILYIAHESGGEILRVAFESHVETYLGPRYDMEKLHKLSSLPSPPRSPLGFGPSGPSNFPPPPTPFPPPPSQAYGPPPPSRLLYRGALPRPPSFRRPSPPPPPQFTEARRNSEEVMRAGDLSKSQYFKLIACALLLE
jgi:hypothetical protein